jgi:hypothetical protein
MTDLGMGTHLRVLEPLAVSASSTFSLKMLLGYGACGESFISMATSCCDMYTLQNHHVHFTVQWSLYRSMGHHWLPNSELCRDI